MLKLRKYLSLASLLFLQGCGFHLSNTTQPISACITGQNAEKIKAELTAPIHCHKNSPKIVTKSSSLHQQEVTNNTNNTLRQYQISHFMTFDILTPQNKFIKTITLKVNKPFISNANGILSSGIEHGVLDAEAKQDLQQKFQKKIQALCLQNGSLHCA